MRLLVIRTSAMGDVALTTPVLRGMSNSYPGVEILLLTRKTFSPFFNSINTVHLFSPDLNGRHHGLKGLLKLFADLRQGGKIDHVVDLHDVLRSKVLRFLFRLSGVPVAVIDKGRSDKRAIIKGKRKAATKHSVERYCDTFARAGFPVMPSDGPWIVPSEKALSETKILAAPGEVINIGVAPYAKHKLKMWPEENMIKLLELIGKKYSSKFWLFGGFEEKKRLEAFSLKVPDATCVSGYLSLANELALMSRLDLMIAMDSSNMHMAALCGIKVISVWGGTDPVCGFGAWKQPEEYFIRIPADELTCRPCTIYGKGECRRRDFACMMWLTPQIVFTRIEKTGILNKGNNSNQ